MRQTDANDRPELIGLFFLLRMGFWFSIVLLFLPIWPEGQDGAAEPVGGFTAIIAAREAVGDLAGMCERKPEVCETGMQAVQTIGVRARESARIAMEHMDQLEQIDESAATGSIAEEALVAIPDNVPVPTPRPHG